MATKTRRSRWLTAFDNCSAPLTEEQIALMPHVYSRFKKTYKTGYVYFLRTKTTRSTKVGYSHGPIEQRQKAVQTGCPEEVEIVGYCSGDKGLESAVHEFLSPHALVGEWFAWNDQIEVLMRLLGCFKKKTVGDVPRVVRVTLRGDQYVFLTELAKDYATKAPGDAFLRLLHREKMRRNGQLEEDEEEESPKGEAPRMEGPGQHHDVPGDAGRPGLHREVPWP